LRKAPRTSLEGRVLPTLVAVRAALAALAGLAPEEGPPEETFFAGERRLVERAHELLGMPSSSRPTALLVTWPTEAADDPSFMRGLAERSVEAVRINCAHDSPDRWERMIGHARAAEKATGRRFKILMDLAGPKIRTGEVRLPGQREWIGKGALLAIVPAGGLGRIEVEHEHFAIECTLSEALNAVKLGDRIYVDDGKLGAEVVRVEEWGRLARVTSAAAKGVRLKPEKGLNFPDTHLKVAALTDKDLVDLDFVAATPMASASRSFSPPPMSRCCRMRSHNAGRTTGIRCRLSSRSRHRRRSITCPTSSSVRRGVNPPPS